LLRHEAQRSTERLLVAPGSDLTVTIHGDHAPLAVPFGRPGATWTRRDGTTSGRATITPDTAWLEWDDLGVCRLQAPDTIDVWPRQDLAPAEAIRLFADDVQPIVYQAFGREALHGSAVLAPTGAVAFCGPSGAGKSTLAYGLSQRGWPQLADDAIVLDCEGDERPRLWPLPFRRSLRAASLDYFQTRPADTATRDPGVARVDRRTPLAAVVLVGQNESQVGLIDLRPLDPARAFSAILPHAHCFDPYDAAEAERLVQDYLTLVSRVPVFALSYRPSFVDFDVLLARVAAIGEGAPIHAGAAGAPIEASA
jgi:hypothetical protein